VPQRDVVVVAVLRIEETPMLPETSSAALDVEGWMGFVEQPLCDVLDVSRDGRFSRISRTVARSRASMSLAGAVDAARSP
jgi:hypothetical protein